MTTPQEIPLMRTADGGAYDIVCPVCEGSGTVEYIDSGAPRFAVLVDEPIKSRECRACTNGVFTCERSRTDGDFADEINNELDAWIGKGVDDETFLAIVADVVKQATFLRVTFDLERGPNHVIEWWSAPGFPYLRIRKDWTQAAQERERPRPRKKLVIQL